MRMLVLAVVLFFIGCVNTGYNPEDDIQKVVIFGYLYANEPVSDVYVRTLIVYGDPEDSVSQYQHSVEDAKVTIKYDNSEKLLVHTSNGQYEASDLIPEIGKTYSIEVIVRDTIHNCDIIATAKTVVPGKAQTPTLSDTTVQCKKYASGMEVDWSDRPEITLSIDNPDHSFYIAQVVNKEENPELIVGTWFPEADFRPFDSEKFRLRMASDFYYFGKYELKVYKLNDEFADICYNKAVVSWTGKVPDPSSSNINNGYGLFTALTCSDIVSFEVIEIADTASTGL